MGEFPDEVVEAAWRRSGGYCECQLTSHGHSGRCFRTLVKANRGREGFGAWEAHHKVRQESGGQPILSNCLILCWDCHRKTL